MPTCLPSDNPQNDFILYPQGNSLGKTTSTFLIIATLIAIGWMGFGSMRAEDNTPLLTHGLYEDFRAQLSEGKLRFPKFSADGKPIAGSGSDISTDTNSIGLKGVVLNPEKINPSNQVTHILARGLTEPLIHEALAGGHLYVANDSLGDPTGFMFGAMNNQGVFTMGDSVTAFGSTKVMALTPQPAKLRLFRGSVMVQETTGTNLTFESKETGDFRLEASLVIKGEERPWIYSNPVYLNAPDLLELAALMPSMEISPEVSVRKDITYQEGAPEDAGKHKLDIYTPKGKTNAPVLFFVHGGAWKTGDRSQYPPLGNRYARAGYLTVVPSYRLAPKYPHPAQIEDIAAAFAWTVKHVAESGGDTNRIYIAGHSAGGHLVSLLALDDHYLAAHQTSPKMIRGVLAWSGVYNLNIGEGLEKPFGKDPRFRLAASPISYVKSNSPPFQITYCQWDYFSLPAQAKMFQHALEKAGAKTELVYIPALNHISEMLNIKNEKDPTVAAALVFMK